MKKLIIILFLIAVIPSLYFLFFRKEKTVDTIAENVKSENQNDVQEEPTLKEDSLKVYKDDVNKFSFSYPKNWEVKNYSSEHIAFFPFSLSSSDDIKNKLSFGIRLNHSKITKSENIKSWWEENGPQVGRQAPYPDEEKLIKVAGQDAYYTVYDTESNAFGFSKTAVVYIYVAHNGNVYEISGDKLPTDTKERGLTLEEIKTIQEYEKVFAKILESFEFID